MNDKKLIELAAKSAGIEGEYKPQYFCGEGPNDHGIYIQETGWVWNPLTHDGDFHRLLVALEISITFIGAGIQISKLGYDSITVFDKNKIKLAGVKLAAEIRRRQND